MFYRPSNAKGRKTAGERDTDNSGRMDDMAGGLDRKVLKWRQGEGDGGGHWAIFPVIKILT